MLLPELDLSTAPAVDTEDTKAAALDVHNPASWIADDWWLKAPAEERQQAAPNTFLNWEKALRAGGLDTKIKGLAVDKEGAEQTDEVTVYRPDGAYTREGLDYINRVKGYFETAAKMPDGGVFRDPYTKGVRTTMEADTLLTKPQKAKDLFPDFDGYMEEKQALMTGVTSPAATFEEYAAFANAEIKNDEARIDPQNKKLKTQFLHQLDRRTFDPGNMDDGEAMRKVGGAWSLNPEMFSEINAMEAAIKGNKEISSADRRMLLIEYRSKVEDVIGGIVNDYASAGWGGIARTFSDSPLRDEFLAAMSKPGASGYEFLKANKERMNKDSYGLGSELTAKLRDATMAVGSGALWLGGAALDQIPGVDGFGEFMSQPAQAWGGLAEDTAKGYHNQTVFDVAGIDITRRDLTELTGQIGSMILMGGMGSLGAKGLGLGATKVAAVETAEQVALNAAKGFGRKSVDFLKASATDPTAYFGGVQAAGMSFGREYNQVLEVSGDRDKAYEAASVQGISDGLSALIATGLMNRVAPGAERILGAGDNSLGSSVIQNLRARSASRAAMADVQKALGGLVEKGSLTSAMRKEFAKDLVKGMNTSARELGLRGFGLAANITAEGVEEGLDEVLSDAIQAMFDDSKSWTEGEWGNIHDHWRQYVKAGFLGAFGGGLGGAYGATRQHTGKGAANYKAKREQLAASWDMIKKNVEQFDPTVRSALGIVGEPTMGVAEYIAAPGPSVKQKVNALVNAASAGYKGSVGTSAVVSQSTPANASTAIPAVNAAPSSAPVTLENPGTIETALSSLYPGQAVPPDLELRVSEKPAIELQDGSFLHVVGIGDETHGSALVVAKDGTARYLTPGDAAKVVAEQGAPGIFGKPAQRKLTDAYLQSESDAPARLTSWTQQSTASNGADAAKPVASKKAAGDVEPPAEGGGDEVAGNGAPKQGSGGKPVAAAEGLTQGSSVTWSSGKQDHAGVIESITEIDGIGKKVPAAVIVREDGMKTTVALAALKPSAPAKGPAAEATPSTPASPAPATSPSRGRLTLEERKKFTQDDKLTLSRSITHGAAKGAQQLLAVALEPVTPENEARHFAARALLQDQSDLGNTEATKALEQFSQAKEPAAPAVAVNPTPVGETQAPDIRMAPPVRPPVPGVSSATKVNPEKEIKREAYKAAEKDRDLAFEAYMAQIWNKEKKAEYERLREIADVVFKEMIDTPFQIPVDSPATVEEQVIALPKAGLDAGSVDTKVDTGMIDDSRPSYVVAAPLLADDNTQADESGGMWAPAEKGESNVIYEYTPGPGKTLPFGVGTVVAVGEGIGEEKFKDTVLVVSHIINNKFIFRKINTQEVLAQALGSKAIKNLGQLSAQWNANRLGGVATKIQGHLGALLGTGPVDDAVFSQILDVVMRLVSPNYDPTSVRYTKLEGKSYFRTETEEVMVPESVMIGGAPFKMKNQPETTFIPSKETKLQTKAVILVDRAKMIAQLRKVLGNYQSGQSKTYDVLTATEVARQISTWAGEEQIHVVASEIFNNAADQARLVEFVDQAAVAKDKAKIIKDILDKTILERIGAVEASTLNEGQKVMIAHETLRKMAQLLATGSFSEIQNSDSRALQAALNLDAAEPGKFKGLRTVMALLRRYMRKIRHMLVTRALLGHLTPEQQDMLKRLDTGIDKANLQLDVDMVGDKVLANDIWTYEQYKHEAGKALTKVAFEDNHTAALVALKGLVGSMPAFPNLTLEDIVVVDYKNGLLSLVPKIREYLTDHPREEVDLKAIDEALDALNAQPLSTDEVRRLGREQRYLVEKRGGESSTRIAQTQLALAARRLESARFKVKNILSLFDGSAFDQLTQTDQRGDLIEDDSRRNLMLENAAKLRRFLDEAAGQSTFHDQNNILLQDQLAKAQEIRDNLETALAGLDQEVYDEIRETDVHAPEGERRLMEIASAIGFDPDPQNFNIRSRDPGFDHHLAYLDRWRSAMLQYAYGFALSGMSVSVSDLTEPGFIDGIKDVWVPSGTLAAKLDPNAVAAARSAQEGRLDAVSAIIDEIRLRISDNPVNMEFADRVDSEFNRLAGYYQSLAEYNDIARNFVRRALGDYGVNSRDIGLSFTDATFDHLLGTTNTSNLVHGLWKGPADQREGISFTQPPVEELPNVGFASQIFGMPLIAVEDSFSIQSYKEGKDEFGKDKWVHKLAMDWRASREINGRTNPWHTLGHSNAAAVGKTFYREFWWAVTNHEILLKDEIDQVSQTGGFNVQFKNNEGEGNEETPSVAFPSLDHSPMFHWASRSFKAMTKKQLMAMMGESLYANEGGQLVLRSVSEDDYLEGLDKPVLSDKQQAEMEKARNLSFFGMLDGMTAWMEEIERTVDSDMVAEVAGKPTLAGYIEPALRMRLDEARRYMIEYRAFLDEKLASFPNTGNITFEQLSTLIQTDNQSSPEPVRHEFEKMKRGMQGLHDIVSQTRTAFAAYTSKAWRGNVQKEGGRTSRDAGYQASKGFSFIRDYAGDIITDNMYEWYLEYAAGSSRKYKITAFFANEALADYNRTEFSNDSFEKLQEQSFAWKKIFDWERDSNGEVVFSQAKDEQGKLLFHKNIFLEAQGKPPEPIMVPVTKLDENGDPKYSLEWLPSGMSEEDAYAYSVTEKDYDGRALNQFTMGEQSVKPADVAREWIAKRMDDPDRMRRRWFSKTALSLGMNLSGERTRAGARLAIDEARRFRDDFARVNAATFDSMVARSFDALFGTSKSTLVRRNALMEEFLQGRGKEPAGQIHPISGFLTIPQKRIDPTDLLRDLIAFKAAKEIEFADKMRVVSGDVIGQADALLAAEVAAWEGYPEQANQGVTLEEVGLIAAQFEKDKNSMPSPAIDPVTGNAKSGGFSLFHASVLRESEQMYVSTNEGLSLLLQNVPGDTLIYSPPKPLYGQDGLIGIRYFPGRSGGPGLIYAPQLQGSDTSRQEAASAMAQALRQYVNNPATASLLADFAASVRNQMDPFMQIGRIEKAFLHDADDLLALADEGVLKLTGGHDVALRELFRQHLVNMLPLIRELGLAFRNQWQKGDLEIDGRVESMNPGKGVVRKASVASSSVDAAALGHKGATYSNEDNILLLVELMTNPKFKEAYDMTRLGDVKLGTTTLGDHSIQAVIDSVLAVRRIGLEDSEGIWENNQDASVEGEEVENDQGVGVTEKGTSLDQLGERDLAPGEVDTSAPVVDLQDGLDELDPDSAEKEEPRILRSLQELDGPALELGDLTKAQSFNRFNARLMQLNKDGSNLGETSNRVFAVLNETKEEWEPGRITPGDAALINLLTGVLEQAKLGQQGAQIAKQGKSNRDILRAQPFESEARPILPEINRDGIYAGNWGSLDVARNGANHTQMTINFSATRREGFMAAMFSLSPLVEDGIRDAALPEVDAANERYARGEKRFVNEYGRAMSEVELMAREERERTRKRLSKRSADERGAPGLYYQKRDAFVVMEGDIYDQIGSVLPAGLLDAQQQEAHARIHGSFNPDTGKREGGLLNLRRIALEKKGMAEKAIQEAEQAVTDQDLDVLFDDLNTEDARGALSRLARRRLMEELVTMRQRHIDTPSRRAAVVADTISRLTGQPRYVSLRSELNSQIARLQQLQVIDGNAATEESDTYLLAQKQIVFQLLKQYENQINHDIHSIIKERFGLLYFEKGKTRRRPALAWLKMPKDSQEINFGRLLNDIANATSEDFVTAQVKEMMSARSGQTLVENLFDVTAGIAAKPSGKGVRGKVRRKAVEGLEGLLTRMAGKDDATVLEELTTLLDLGFDSDFKTAEGLAGHNLFTEMMRTLIPTREDRLELAGEAGLLSGDASNRIRVAQVVLARAEGVMREVDEALGRIRQKSSQPWRIGRTYHKVDSGNEFEEDPLVPVELHFLPEELDGVLPHEMEQATAVLEERFDAEEDPGKYDFYIQMQAMERALQEYADKHADTAYKLLRGDSDYFNQTSPVKLVSKAVDTVNAEIVATRTRLEQWRKDITTDGLIGLQHLDPDAFAVLADPANGTGTIIAVTGTDRQKAKVRLLKSPKGAQARKELFGHLVEQEGTWIVLAATTAKRDMQRRFGFTGKGSNAAFRKLVLDALPVTPGPAGAIPQRMGFSTDYVNQPYDRDVMVEDLDAEGNPVAGTSRNMRGATRKEVADRLIADFNRRFIKLLNHGVAASDTKAIKVDDEAVLAALSRHEYMIRNIIYAHGHALLSPSLPGLSGLPEPGTAEMVDNFVKRLQPRDVSGVTQKMHSDAGFAQLQEMNTEEVFARVLAEIEGDQIIDRLMTGLVTDPSATVLFMAKYAHHQDARMRGKFVYDYTAVQEATRLHALLDRGFDGVSGRTGYKVQMEAMKERLEKFRKKLERGPVVGANSLDQSKARTWAWLEGVKLSRSGNLNGNLSREIENFRKGASDILKLEKAQQGLDRGVLSRFANDEHVDLLRDVPMVREMARLLGPIFNDYQAGMPDAFRKSATGQEKTKDDWALAKIAEAQALLLADNDKATEIKAYGVELVKVFKSLTDALSISRALSFEETDPTENKKVFSTFGSVVPMLYQHANMPGSKRINLENPFREDPKEIVNVQGASMFGSAGRFNRNKSKTVLRPVNMNGLSGVDALIDDALYRLNVAPNYNVLRKVVGRRIQNPNNKMDEIEGSHIAERWKDLPVDDSVRSGRVALAAVANELENDIENDSRQGVVSTHMSEASKFLASNFIAKALTSVLQLLVQTAPAILMTPVKFLVVGDVQAAGDFVNCLARSGASAMLRHLNWLTLDNSPFKGDFANKLDKAVFNLSPWNTFRGTDGMDKSRIIGRRTNRYGQNVVKKVVGRALKELESLQEKGLDLTIASGERWVSRSLYATELIRELRSMQRENPDIRVPASIDELIDGSFDTKSIPVEAKEHARRKVNDMFGQADQAKKAWLFQTRTTSSGWNDLMRSSVRFSNHTATTSSNMTALAPAFGIKVRSPVKFRGGVKFQAPISIKDMSGPDRAGQRRMREEALENFVGTIGQNILFHFVKPRVLTTLVAMAAYLFSGDDKDEAMAKAMEVSDDLMKQSDDGNPVANLLKMFTFGKGDGLFQDWRDPESARRSAYADLTSKVMIELSQAIPGFGVLFGYSPVSQSAKPFFDGVAEHLATLGSDLEVAHDNMDDEGVHIYDREKGPLQYAAQLTAPTMALYDLGAGAAMSYQAIGLEGISAADQAMLWTTQIWSPRETNAMIESKFKEVIRENEE